MFSTKDPFSEWILRIWAITGYHSEAWPVADIQVLHRGWGDASKISCGKGASKISYWRGSIDAGVYLHGCQNWTQNPLGGHSPLLLEFRREISAISSGGNGGGSSI